MSFASPWMLVSLVAVPVVVGLYVSSSGRRARRAEVMASQALVLTASSARVGWRRHLPFALLALALTSMLVALAKPEATIGLPRREGTVILAFDVSNSMRADDLRPTRLAAAKAAARAFVRRQPSSIRIGVVAFGDGAALVRSPTHSHPDVLAAVARLTTGGGTSLGQGLFASLTAIAGKSLDITESDIEKLDSETADVHIGYYGSGAVVALTDGENTSQLDPLAVAKLASLAGVKVHAIGLGTDSGSVVDVDGFKVGTMLDRGLLTQIASTTDGRYYAAGDTAALAKAYKSIDLKLTRTTKHTEVTAVFTIVGSLLLLAGALLSVVWFGRVV